MAQPRGRSQLFVRLSGAARAVVAAVAAAALLVPAGCTSATQQGRATERRAQAAGPRRPAAPPGRAGQQQPSAIRPPQPGEPPSSADECASRLHDVSGLLLQYYLLNRQLPATLEDLVPLADAGVEVNLNCTASGQPYVYTPGGRRAPGSERVLVLYDPIPAHNGFRWAVTMTPPVPGQAWATWVVPLTDAVIASYTLPGIEPPPEEPGQ